MPDYDLAKAIRDVATKLHPHERESKGTDMHGFWFTLIDMLYTAEKKVLEGDGRAR